MCCALKLLHSLPKVKSMSVLIGTGVAGPVRQEGLLILLLWAVFDTFWLVSNCRL